MDQSKWVEYLQSSAVLEQLERNTKPLVAHPLPFNRACADETLKFSLSNEKGTPVAFAICSNKVSPLLIARASTRSQEAYQALDAPNKKHILYPLFDGELEGCTYAIYPYCLKTTNNRLWWKAQRMALSPLMLNWLLELVKQTKQSAAGQEKEFLLSLQHIEQQNSLSNDIRKEAEKGRLRLEKGKWKPQFTLMHGDIWKENILFRQGGWKERLSLKSFVIADWAGANLQGYPMYDLVRLADSFNMRNASLLKECKCHASVLGCELEDLSYYLLAALGYIGRNIEHFPYDRWCQLTDRSYGRLSSTVDII